MKTNNKKTQIKKSRAPSKKDKTSKVTKIINILKKKK